MKKVLLAAVALLVAACVPVPSQSSLSPSPSESVDYYNQPVTWSDCHEFLECATLIAPLDWNDPAGETIELAIARHRADRPGQRVGTLFANPGGPGGSGIDYLTGYAYAFSDQVINKFDLVSWDPRGVGASTAIDCITDAEMDELVAMEPTPDTPAEEAESAAYGEWFVEQCQQKSGDLINHVSTVDTVRDLDMIRAVLAEPKLNYLGKSYGTELGAVYASMFPQNVGRMVLDGAVDLSLNSNELALGQAKGFDRALSRFARYCLTASIVCDLGTTEPEIIGKITGLLNSLDQKPLPTEDGDRVLTEGLAWTAIIGPMYVPDGGWDWLIEGLRAALDGDGTGLLGIADWFWSRNPDGSYADNSSEANIAINCLDFGATGRTSQDLLPEFTAAAPVTGRLLAWGEGGCENWPGNGEPLPTSIAAPSAPPILVIGTSYDPATPNVWAQALAQQLGVGVYINYKADGHTAYLSGATDLDKAVDAFWIDGTLPAAGTVYEPDFAWLL